MRVKGEVKYDKSIPYMLHPDFEILGSSTPEIPDEWTSVEAVYPSIEGVADKKLRGAIQDAFRRLQPYLGDIIPLHLLVTIRPSPTRQARVGTSHSAHPPHRWPLPRLG